MHRDSIHVDLRRLLDRYCDNDCASSKAGDHFIPDLTDSAEGTWFAEVRDLNGYRQLFRSEDLVSMSETIAGNTKLIINRGDTTEAIYTRETYDVISARIFANESL